MASTRNINMKNDYCLEARSYEKKSDYNLFKNKRIANKTMMPCAGVNIGHIPNSELSWNAVNIESQLFGIGSTNMVENKAFEALRAKKMDNISFFDRMEVYIPEPLALEKNQRPNIFRR